MRLRTALLLLSLAALSTDCTGSQAAEASKTEASVAGALVSDEQENQIGQQVQSELEKQGIKYSTDPQVNAYVQGLVAKLTPFAQKDRQVAYTVHVIDDPKTVNAFATAGGFVNVYSGLLLTADNEAEVVGVLAHEMGHVVARHAARQMVNEYGLETVAALAFGKNPNLLAQVATGIVANGTLLAHSRFDENEADGYAVKYSAEAGYDPHGISMFFGKLLAQEGKTPKILTWLQTHPATEDRVAHVNQLIKEQGLSGGELGPERLAPIKQRLQGP